MLPELQRENRTLFVPARCSLFSCRPHGSFPDIKIAARLQRSHKSDKWKATRLLNARVNVNNDNGSATRERKADSKWETSRVGTGWDASLVRLHRWRVIRKDVITPPINGAFDSPRKLMNSRWMPTIDGGAPLRKCCDGYGVAITRAADFRIRYARQSVRCRDATGFLFASHSTSRRRLCVLRADTNAHYNWHIRCNK